MSQHPSLCVDSVGTKHRNVLKRFERIKKMQETSKWGTRESAYNLPKVKSIKVKVKKSGAGAGKKEEAGDAKAKAGTPKK